MLKQLLLAFCFVCSSWGASLEWNASVVDETHSAPTGYRIHRGSAPGVYDWQIDVGNVLQWPIPDDLYGEYYWSASAYNDAGSSGYSNEVYWQRAPPEPPQYAGAINLRASKLQQQPEQPIMAISIGGYTTIANNDATIDWGRTGVFDYIKQSFVLPGSGTVTVGSVKIYAQRIGTPGAYDVILQIYTGTASTPDTQVTNASSQQSPAAWSTDWAWQELVFSSPVTLTLGTTYVLVLTATGNLRIDSGNKIAAGLDGSSSPYTDGECRYGTDLTSTNQAGGDIFFDLWDSDSGTSAVPKIMLLQDHFSGGIH